eukprot:TRINITY_DN1752_c0_g2_i4.p1 TRINITY_DN1752_c0_g2~~TRINITY_DN1752_c0_g2_i4.p1  ORF type:complete len:672 (+),score=72.54 TRINITY_DN1752_c0_g2_i4:301-2316(+)
MISSSATSPTLSDKTQYPTFARVVPSDSFQGVALAKLCANLGWRNVAVLYTTDSYSSKLAEVFFDTAKQLKLSVLSSQSFEPGAQDVRTQLSVIQASGANIILLLLLAQDARTVFLYAKTMDMIGPPYLYIGVDGWFEATNSLLQPDVASLVSGSIATLPFIDDQSPSYQKFLTDWQAAYARSASQMLGLKEPDFWAALQYDTVNVLAYGLDRLIKLQDFCQNKSISTLLPAPAVTQPRAIANLTRVEQCYLMRAVGEDTMLRYLVLAYPYDGLSGRVLFDANGDRLADLRIRNIQNQQFVDVGLIDSEGRLVWDEGVGVIWPGGSRQPPKDQRFMEYVLRTVNRGALVAIGVLSVIGAVFTCILLVLNFYFRQRSIIKMSSPRINNFILLGCLLSYVSCVMLGLDSQIWAGSFASLCSTQVWILCLSFSLAFGALFSKTHRIYTIFSNAHMQVTVISDRKLILLLGGIVSVDCFILVFWTFLDGFDRSVSIMKDASYVDGSDMTKKIIPTLESCTSPHATTFGYILIIIKAFLLLVGVYLAYRTRNVDIPALNDSRYIGFAIYNVSCICVVVLPVVFALQQNPTIQYLVSSLGIFLATTSTLCLIFLPKLFAIHHQTDQELVTARPTSSGNRVSSPSYVSVTNKKEEPISPSSNTSSSPPPFSSAQIAPS